MSSILLSWNNLRLISSMVRIVARPKRNAAKENGGASFKAPFTSTNVTPQMMVTKMSPICAINLLFFIFQTEKNGSNSKG